MLRSNDVRDELYRRLAIKRRTAVTVPLSDTYRHWLGPTARIVSVGLSDRRHSKFPGIPLDVSVRVVNRGLRERTVFALEVVAPESAVFWHGGVATGDPDTVEFWTKRKIHVGWHAIRFCQSVVLPRQLLFVAERDLRNTSDLVMIVEMKSNKFLRSFESIQVATSLPAWPPIVGFQD